MDLIDRQAAIELIERMKPYHQEADDIAEMIANMPSAQPEPSEITDEQAIMHLQSTGWMQNHDREMYESGLRERLADDSGSYDSLLPSVQPEPHYDEWCTDCKEYDHARHCCPRWNRVIRETLKDAPPEIIRCKDCKFYTPMNRETKTGICRLLMHQNFGDDWYCAGAERRTDG